MKRLNCIIHHHPRSNFTYKNIPAGTFFYFDKNGANGDLYVKLPDESSRTMWEKNSALNLLEGTILDDIAGDITVFPVKIEVNTYPINEYE